MKDEWEKEKKGLDVKRVKLVNDVKGLQTLVDKLLKKKWPPLATRSTSPSRVRFEAEKKQGGNSELDTKINYMDLVEEKGEVAFEESSNSNRYLFRNVPFLGVVCWIAWEGTIGGQQV